MGIIAKKPIIGEIGRIVVDAAKPHVKRALPKKHRKYVDVAAEIVKHLTLLAG